MNRLLKEKSSFKEENRGGWEKEQRWGNPKVENYQGV